MRAATATRCPGAFVNGWPEPHERSDRFVPAIEAREKLAAGALALDEAD